MLRIFRKAIWPSRDDSLSQSFSSLGWLGFWMQIVVGLVPLALTIYALAFGHSPTLATRAGLPLMEYFSIAGLFVLAFTAFWSFRYTRFAIRLGDPQRRPTKAAMQRMVWTGVKAGTFGIVLSMLVMLFEVVQLLIYFLRAPQAGVQVVQTTEAAASWVSAADVAGLLALLITTYVEVTVLVFSLWLLFRTTLPSLEFPQVDNYDDQ